MKRKALAMVAALVMSLSVAAPALAGPPGPGDKQCTPGQNAQPQPGKKGGTCPGR
jgi:hypothetical protein